MKRNIAVAAALIVVFGVFYKDFVPVPFSIPSLEVTTPENASVSSEAWAVFEQYREFAKTHDLEGVKRLSHQLSTTCTDPTKILECYSLMDNVYAMTANWRQVDFQNIYADERQIVMLTTPPEATEETIPVQFALFFTRNAEGTPKVLGVKICFGGEKCVETDPLKRDLDKNGWWDDVEVRFYK